MTSNGSSDDLDALYRALRQAGQRLTPGRSMVLAVLASQNGHLTAEEILDAIRPEYPHVNLSTIYRTLDRLCQLGLVTETDLGGGARRFELAGQSPHHHLICRVCGVTIEIDDGAFEPVREHVRERYGFEAAMSHVAIFGTCHQCRDVSIDGS